MSMDHQKLLLIQQARGGDSYAFTKLVEGYWFPLVRMSRSILGDLDAEDVVQEGFIMAWRKLHTLKEDNAFYGWLNRIVLNKSLTLARRRKFVNMITFSQELHTRIAPDATIDVAQALSLLAPKQRAVMYFTAIEGMVDTEIAEIMKISAGSVRTHRKRARQRLNSYFERDEK